jgi:anti-sigma B factor antagonist/stage II sporulation protein AA (anti-sigma F factor antagonist)
MEFTSLRYAEVVVAAPVGRVDHSTAGSLEQALLPLLEPSTGAAPAIVLDFSGVHYISSAGLRVLMIAAKKMQARKAALGVASLQPMVQAIFEATRWDQVVDVFPSVRAALRTMSGTALAAWETAAGPGTT